MKQITIFVKGNPKAQPRVKAFSRGGHAGVYTPKTADDWKKEVISEAEKAGVEKIEGPIQIEIKYFIKRPKNLMRKKDYEGKIPHTKKPDIDNLNKSVFDALTRSGIWGDDSQVYKVTAEKYYHGKLAGPGAAIRIFYDQNND